MQPSNSSPVTRSDIHPQAVCMHLIMPLVQAIETMPSPKSDSTPNITSLYPTNPMQIQKPYAIKGTRVELGGALGISKPNADEKAASP